MKWYNYTPALPWFFKKNSNHFQSKTSKSLSKLPENEWKVLFPYLIINMYTVLSVYVVIN